MIWWSGKKNIVSFSDLQALYTQYLHFKEHDIPLKENEKTKIKNLYKMLEVRANKKKSIHQLARCILMAAVHLSVITCLCLRHCLLTDVDRVRTHSVTRGLSP